MNRCLIKEDTQIEICVCKDVQFVIGEVKTKGRYHDAPWSGSTPKGKEADSTLMVSIWERGTFTHCRLGLKAAQSLWKTAWQFVKAKHNIAI